MAPPKDAVATLAQVVGAAKLGAPELEGPGPADRWEGHTENGLRLWAGREAGRPGYTVRWEYHNALGQKIQNAVRAVKTLGLGALATAVREANADAVPDVMPAVAAGPGADPVLANRAALAEVDYADGRQVFAPPPGDGLTGFGELSAARPSGLTKVVDAGVGDTGVKVEFRAAERGPHADPAPNRAADGFTPPAPAGDPQDQAEAEAEAETERTEVPDGQSDPNVEAEADHGYGDGDDADGVAGGDELP